MKSTPCHLAYRSNVEQVDRLIRRRGPVKMLVQEFKRTFSVNAVPALEELDLRAVGYAELDSFRVNINTPDDVKAAEDFMRRN